MMFSLWAQCLHWNRDTQSDRQIILIFSEDSHVASSGITERVTELEQHLPTGEASSALNYEAERFPRPPPPVHWKHNMGSSLGATMNGHLPDSSLKGERSK